MALAIRTSVPSPGAVYVWSHIRIHRPQGARPGRNSDSQEQPTLASIPNAFSTTAAPPPRIRQSPMLQTASTGVVTCCSIISSCQLGATLNASADTERRTTGEVGSASNDSSLDQPMARAVQSARTEGAIGNRVAIAASILRSASTIALAMGFTASSSRPLVHR